jgi:pimeloyl-ACP methyl ester carboxylesterase
MLRFDHRSGQTVAHDGAKIYVEVHGDAKDPTLILLHGGLGTIEDLNPILSRLDGKFRVVGIDSRGHGRSTLGTGRLSYARLAADVERVIAHLGLDRFAILGFSDGGIVGYRLAAAWAIDRLITIGAPWMLGDDDPTRVVFAGVTAEGWKRKFPETVKRYEALNPSPDFASLVPAAVNMWLDDGPTGYPGASVKRIGCEVLMVRGDDDPLVALNDLVALKSRVKGAHLCVVPFAGHEAHVDQPQAVMVAVNRFLNRERRPGA